MSMNASISTWPCRRVSNPLDDAIAHGAPAATIMSLLVLEADSEPNLKRRVTDKVRDAGLLICGGNGMGFYNFRDRVIQQC